jgi:glucokinase
MRILYGVDIGGTDTKLGIVQEDGTILSDGSVPTDHGAGPEKLAARAADWFSRHAAGRASAAGVGCAGLVDAKGGMLFVSPNMPGWNDVPLAGIFSASLALPVRIENDVNAAAFGEFQRGAGRGVRNFICLTLGTGVGGGIVIDGKLYRGSNGFAGEIGHTVLIADGPRCACGSRGCLEALIGASAIIERARRIRLQAGETALDDIAEPSVKEIAHAARGGDAAALRVMEETGRYLGIGLSNLVHLFDPAAIAVGGGISNAGELILAPARAALSEHAMNERHARTRIVTAELGNKASFLGAALLAARDE